MTSEFHPTITYRVPMGWGNFEDLLGNFLLIPPNGDLAGVDPGTSDYIGIYTSIAADKPDCTTARNIAATPEAISNYYRARQDLVTTKPKAVSVGGLEGIVIDVKSAQGVDGACLFVASRPRVCSKASAPGW
jgi:hypothetical protein